MRYLEVRPARTSEKFQKFWRAFRPNSGKRLCPAPQHQDQRRNAPVFSLFTEGRAAGTILLWIPFFMNLLMLYFVVSWLPVSLRQTGKTRFRGRDGDHLVQRRRELPDPSFEGNLMNRWGALTVLLTEFLCTTLLIASLAYSNTFALTMAITFVLGFVVQGAQGGLSAVAATFYPISIRSTGIGWCLGVGRIGSIVGPMLGGVMLEARLRSPREIFLAGSIPALCAAAATFLSLRLRSNLPRRACGSRDYRKIPLYRISLNFSWEEALASRRQFIRSRH